MVGWRLVSHRDKFSDRDWWSIQVANKVAMILIRSVVKISRAPCDYGNKNPEVEHFGKRAGFSGKRPGMNGSDLN